MWTLWSMVALAKVYDVDLYLVAPQDPGPDGWARQGFVGHYISHVRGPDGQTDVIVDDGSMQVSCVVHEGVLWLHLGWTTPRAWTGRIPQHVQCRVGRHRIRADLRQLPPRYSAPEQLRAGPDRRVELRLFGGDFPAFQWFGLPADVRWAEGTYPWVGADGVEPDAIRCEVDRGNALKLEVIGPKPGGRGACLLRDQRGEPIPVPVDLVICSSLAEVVGQEDAGCPTP